MRAHAILDSTRKRMTSPSYWALIVLLGVVWNLLSLVVGLGFPPLRVAISPFYWGLLIVMVFPMPWQWSGDARPLPGFSRGLVQAILWDLAWVLLIVNLAQALQRSWDRHHVPTVTEWTLRLSPQQGHRPPPVAAGFMVLGLGLLAGLLMARQEKAEEGEMQALQAADRARMSVLQSQMNPHVLFNVISGLCEMARVHPEATERALLNLSGFLRELLDYGARNLAPLSWERAMVERYLSLEQIRLGRRLRPIWEWDSSLEGLELPPLMLQPLVENAIKHGIAPHVDGGELRIRLAGHEDALELEVANTGVGLVDPRSEGIGLRNVRERLTFFDPGAKLSLFREGDWTRAQIRLGRRP